MTAYNRPVPDADDAAARKSLPPLANAMLILQLFAGMTVKQREEIMLALRGLYCPGCWRDDPGCQCCNEE